MAYTCIYIYIHIYIYVCAHMLIYKNLKAGQAQPNRPRGP